MPESKNFQFFSPERSCRSPTVKLPSLSPNVTSSLIVRRANRLIISSEVVLDCELSSETVFNWDVYDLHSQSREHPVLSKYGGFSEFLIRRGKLLIGIYVVRLTVKMAGTQVFGFSEGYIRVIESPLVAHIAGGTKVERRFNKTLVFDASLSRDPDSFHPPHGKLTTLLFLIYRGAAILPILKFTLIINRAPTDCGKKYLSNRRFVVYDRVTFLLLLC